MTDEQKKPSILQEFKNFAVRGNAVDLAVGVIIGAAFGKIVTSLVNDIFTPILGMITGGIDFSNRFVSLDGQTYSSLDAAQASHAAVITYGAFLQNIVDFVLVAIIIFFMVKLMNRLLRKEKNKTSAQASPTKDQQLLMEIRDILKNKQ